MTKDYYSILGVGKDASREDIKKAYKRLAKQHHPDLNKNDPNASEKFKEINEAAAILGDDTKRKHYDTYGTAESGGQGGFEGFSGFDFSNAGFEMDFGDIFESFFGGGQSRRRGGAHRGSDLRYDLEITLKEAATGVSKSISIPKSIQCAHCHGSGAASTADVVSCSTCHGNGVVRRTQRTPFGLFQTQTTCPDCRGQGTSIRNPCTTCHGRGVVHKTSTIELDIPKGSFSGMQLRVRGEGEAGERGAQTGDLYVVIRVAEDEVFERVDNDIVVQVPLTFVQAALGAEIEVPTLTGQANLTIPPGTQSGTTFRIKGKGIPDIEGGAVGAELVKVIVEIPTKLTKEQRELLLEFDKSYIKKKKSFLERVFE